MQKKILITGATGNVGFEVIKSLCKIPKGFTIMAGVRNISRATEMFTDYNCELAAFDFEKREFNNETLRQADSVFILRPPHISNVTKYFVPLIQDLQTFGVKEVTFLSVQGVEKSSVIPHHKIEILIKESGLDYVFLRPAYFMQNLTTTLRKGIVEDHEIYLPAGNAKFNWVDLEDIGSVGAEVLTNFEHYRNTAFDLTGNQNLSFKEVVRIMTDTLGRQIQFKSPSLAKFYIRKRKEGLAPGLILVMMMLHYLPRFQKSPSISQAIKQITDKTPTAIEEFLIREKTKLLSY